MNEYKMENKQIKEFRGEPSNACPSFFRACCVEARKGGTHSYREAGWHLSIHLDEQIDDPRAMDELTEIIDNELIPMDEISADRVILVWFGHYLPLCMQLVPKRRRGSFVKGFWQAVEDNRVFT